MANLQTTITASYAQTALGSTAQRPGGPSAGAMRYNTDLKYTEIYNGTSWNKFAHSATVKNHADVATSSGQHITYQHDVYKVHQFPGAGSHTFTPRYTGTVEVLVIAGGGGGGRHSGGGGGAGDGTGTTVGGAGGLYGGGGGGGASSVISTRGIGASGVLVMTYTPLVVNKSNFFLLF